MQEGRRVANPVRTYGLSNLVLDEYIRTSTETLVAERWLVGKDRYLVVSVDPAAGGVNSEEAFTVFLVSGPQIALLSGRIVVGKTSDVPFSVIPLSFVLALLDTVKKCKRLLQTAHEALSPPVVFQMPRVLVVVEANFAYGAAVYMQLMYFIQARTSSDSELMNLEIIFATPVYATDTDVMQLMQREQHLQKRLSDLRERRRSARNNTRSVWTAKRRTPGMDHSRVLQQIRATVQQLRSRRGIPTVAQGEEEDDEDEDEEEVIARANPPRNIQFEIDQEINTVLDSLIDQSVQDPARRTELRRIWLAEYGSALRDQLKAEHVYDMALLELKEIRRNIRVRTEDDPSAPPDTVPLSMWPVGHTLDLNADRIRWPNNFSWQADKRTFGEWTTAAGKIAAYRMFVWMLNTVPQGRLMLLSSGPRPTGNGCEELYAANNNLPNASDVLRCIHAQWSCLGVWANPTNVQHILRVEGKQPSQKGKRCHDDVYMSFAVGLRWCWRFCRMLPNAAVRHRLVTYMNSLRETVHSALTQSLTLAGITVVDEMGNELRPPTTAPSPTPTRAPAHPTTDAQLSAQVVVLALARAVKTEVFGLYHLLRHLLAAMHITGYGNEIGWSVTVAQRTQSRTPLSWYKSEVCKQTVLHKMELQKVKTTYTLPMTNLRLVCDDGPGPRYAWPGYAARTDKRSLHQAFPHRIDQLTARLLDLKAKASSEVCKKHFPEHPLMQMPQVVDLFSQLLDRASLVVGELQSLWLGMMDARVQSICNQCETVGEICAQRSRSGVRSEGRPIIPLSLFVAVAQIAEDVRFLNHIISFCRRLTVEAISERSLQEWKVPATPGVLCRINRTKRVDWTQALRHMWPEVLGRRPTKKSTFCFLLVSPTAALLQNDVR